MNYYALAEDEIKTLQTLFNAGQYRHAVYHSCLCVELLLKTKLVQMAPTSELLEGHDIINIFKTVQEKYKSSNDLTSAFLTNYLHPTQS